MTAPSPASARKTGEHQEFQETGKGAGMKTLGVRRQELGIGSHHKIWENLEIIEIIYVQLDWFAWYTWYTFSGFD